MQKQKVIEWLNKLEPNKIVVIDRIVKPIDRDVFEKHVKEYIDNQQGVCVEFNSDYSRLRKRINRN